MKSPFALRRFAATTLVANALLVGALAVGIAHAAPGDAPAQMTPFAPTIAAPGATTLAQALAMPPLPADAPHADEINAFQQADRVQAPPQNAVLFIGSSSIRRWETLAQDFPEISVINRGFGGSILEESVNYADRIAIPYRPKIVVVFAGGNDLNRGDKTPEQVLSDFQTFVAKIHSALPDTRVVYISINPTDSRWKGEDKLLDTNYLIQKYIILNNAPDNKMTFINSHDLLLGTDGKPQTNLLRDDGLHLNKDGYRVWTGIIRDRLMPLVAADGVARLDVPAAK